CTTFNIVFGALGRAYSAERRSVVLGVASAAGSFGQFAVLPLALVLISGLGWYAALIALSVLVAVVMPASFGVADKGYHGTLSGLYAARGVAIALLIAFPLTPMSAYLFAAAMGFLWLGTVPLTNGVVAGIFGVKHLAMLSGFVFFFHQLGSFFGGWLGGYLFDRTGSYQLVWLIAIGLSVISVVVNLPIDERPVKRAGEA